MAKRCVIITSYIEPESAKILDLIELSQDDYVVCADGGYTKAKKEGIAPDLIVGDFDSNFEPIEPLLNVVRLSPFKDDTDTLQGAKYGLSEGCRDFVILGGIGGRMDHTLGNLQIMSWLLDNDCNVRMMDGNTTIHMTDSNLTKIQRTPDHYFSLFAYSDTCTGITLEGAMYPLNNATLTRSTPVGVSNEFDSDEITVRKSSGRILILLVRKR